MKTLLQAVYDDLLHEGKVKSKTDLGLKLELSRGRISQVIASNDPLPKTMQEKLNKLYGYSLEWLASNGKQGTMFARNGAHERKHETNSETIKNDKLNINPQLQFGTDFDVSKSSPSTQTDMDRILRIAERLSIAIEEDAFTKRELAKTLTYFREMAEENRERGSERSKKTA